MKLTTKGRYAVTAMMDLALHAKIDYVTLAEISGRQNISLAYLEQLFASLRKAGLVESIRGPKGGYRVARPTSDISLADILIAANEEINLTCGNGKTCDDVDPCLTHGLWSNLSQEFFQFLNSKKLSALVQSKYVQTKATQQDVTQIGDIPIHIGG
ncbi:MAG: Rrf2 family transcriptional regulator [Acidiferrobacterales bacterium]|nr:Rrf2 family transcriptional regulator [Acidiferrobacterales bacterium]